jgi:micrococcal nuclease
MPAPLVVIGAIAVAGVVGVAGVVTVTTIVNDAASTDHAVVEHVIDGDTVDVRVGDSTERVRLLNIDAPEDNKSTGVTECMGAEATHALSELLPGGTEITLKYDNERRDKYDRLLAGVFIGETFVNAEMTRAGLAGALIVGDNDRFFADVASAAEDGKTAGVGIYGDELPCTLGAAVETYERQVSDVASAALPADSATLTQTLASADALLAGAVAADAAIDAIDWIDLDVRSSYHHGITAAKKKATTYHSSIAKALASAKAAEEAEAARIAAEKAEADRQAAAQAEADRQAAAQAEADRRAAEARRQSSSSGGGSTSTGGSGSSGGSGSTGGSGGYDGYTGCRAYGGGYVPNAIDEKGRPYTKIDCTTKLPIGG